MKINYEVFCYYGFVEFSCIDSVYFIGCVGVVNVRGSELLRYF